MRNHHHISQTPTPDPIAQPEPLSEGWYRVSSLASPQIELSGAWAIDGSLLTTTGGQLDMAFTGQWILLSWAGEITACINEVCVTRNHDELAQAGFRGSENTNSMTITSSNASIDNVVILNGDDRVVYVPVIEPADGIRVAGGQVELSMTAGDLMASSLLMSAVILLAAILAVGVYRWK